MYFAVIRRPGPNWDPSRTMRRQDRWDEHAAFMDGLAEEGFLLLVGPLGDAAAPERVLAVVDAAGPQEVQARLAEDPWVPMGLLVTVSVDRWVLAIGTIGRGGPGTAPGSDG